MSLTAVEWAAYMLNGAASLASRVSDGFCWCVLLVTAFFVGCDSKSNPMPESAALYLDAQKQFAAGENEKALESLTNSISQEPSSWAYYLRAQVHLKLGDEQKAKADCDAGLEITPGDAGLAWLKGELAKPAAARFQGAFKNPPSADR